MVLHDTRELGLMQTRTRPDAETAQRVLMARKALNDGKLQLPPHMEALAQEIKDAPLLANGLVDTTRLSSSALMLARSAGMALLHGKHEAEPAPSTMSSANLQETLFALFAQLFGALTGRAVDLVTPPIPWRRDQLSDVDTRSRAVSP